jgi:CubicO group peptidase (beta-lactamase class C family)
MDVDMQVASLSAYVQVIAFLCFVTFSHAALGTADGALDSAIQRLMKQQQVPGVAIAVIERGRITAVNGYGLANKAKMIPVTGDTVFQAASISKPVSASLVMKLVQEGKLDLDQPVTHYLKHWRLPVGRYSDEGVTLRCILSHTAGLSIPGYFGFRPGKPLQTIKQSLIAAADAGNQPLAIMYPPGKAFHYSGGVIRSPS